MSLGRIRGIDFFELTLCRHRLHNVNFLIIGGCRVIYLSVVFCLGVAFGSRLPWMGKVFCLGSIQLHHRLFLCKA